jgi:hypothetical protein
LAACGDSERRAVSETRTVMPSDSPPAAAASSAARFGLQGAHAAAPQAEGKPALIWQAPDGWRDAGTKGLRLANFKVGAASEAECYVTVLGGTGGGVGLNVNRWRAQLGLPEASPDELAALPKIPMLGGEAVFVDIAGIYGAMGDGVHTSVETARQDYGLLGAIVIRGSDAVFAKMTGPLDVVRAEREKFTAFVGSIQDTGASSNRLEK